MNNWSLDQGIVKVKYDKGDAKNGALITVENLDKMVMPVVIEVKTKSGIVSRKSLPVEIWQRNKAWTFKVDTTEELETVTLDPDNVFPDINDENNVWTDAKNGVDKAAVGLDGYIGDYSSVKIPIKVNFTVEDESLVINTQGQPSVPLEDKGNGKFSMDQAGLSIQFNAAKDGFTLNISGQSFEFTKDKK